MKEKKLHKLGNLVQINWYLSQGCRIESVFIEWSEKYGKKVVCCTFDSEDEIYIAAKEKWMSRKR